MLRSSLKLCRVSHNKPRQYVTEERLSIRESLQIFNKIDKSNHSLEDLCRFDHGKLLFTPVHTCGNTMRCFLSLFLDDRNIRSNKLDYIMNGNVFQQFYNNTNVLFYTYNRWEDVFNDINNRICGNNFLKFKKTILEDNENEILPRILFVSLVWSTKSNHTSPTAALNDHKFTIIKYDNDNYRFIMGHINTSSSGSDHASDSGDNSIGLTAYKLKTNAFNDVEGFDKNMMLQFLDLMEVYVRQKTFNSTIYKDMFSVTTTNTQDHDLYMPSLYHFELLDSALSGYGHVNRLAKRIETRL